MTRRTKVKRLHGWCWPIAFTIACAIPASAFAQGPQQAKAQLESVFKDWQDRQGILKSARYVITGETVYKDSQLPPGNPVRPYRSVLLLDLAKKRYRLESSEEIPYANGKDDPKEWEYRTRISTSTYDGEALQKYRHKKPNQLDDDLYDLSITKGNLGPHATFPDDVWPVFMAHGIVATVHTPLLVDKLPLTFDSDDYDVAGWQLLQGQNCLVVRTQPTGNAPLSDEFWINPQQKSAIHRHVYLSGSNPWDRFDIFWKNTDYGWWVDRWSKTWTQNGRVRRIHHLSLETFEANPGVSDADFTLPAEPGMTVIVGGYPPPGKGLDPFKAAMKTYIISPSGSWDEISAKGFTTLDGKELPPEGNRKWLVWTIGFGASLVALLFYALHWRRKKLAS